MHSCSGGAATDLIVRAGRGRKGGDDLVWCNSRAKETAATSRQASARCRLCDIATSVCLMRSPVDHPPVRPSL